MAWFARALAERGIRVARFEFPYMAARRGPAAKRRPPDRPPVLIDTWRRVIASLRGNTLVIGGKSLGGRIASMVADEEGVAGLVCLGYPFHPPGKPEATRVEHMAAMRTPALILQGTRDPFGGADEVAGYALSPAIEVRWMADGDHGFKPRKSSGRTEMENWEDAARAIDAFVTLLGARLSGRLSAADTALPRQEKDVRE